MVNVTETVLKPLSVQFGIPYRIKNKNSEVQKENLIIFAEPWQRSLGHYSEQELSEAYYRAIEDCEYFPKLKEFKKIVADVCYEKKPIKHDNPEEKPKTWREKNEHLFAEWYNQNQPTFVGTDFMDRMLRLATVMIYKKETAKEAERQFNVAIDALNNLKNNQPPCDEDVERLRKFTYGYCTEVSKHVPQ